MLSRARISSNGQISIPASVRRRWGATEVIVIDKGDRLIVRPIPADPFSEIVGKYAGSPSSDELRERARGEDAELERRRS